MKSHASRWAGYGLAVLTLSTQALGQESLPPLEVPARTVPVPTTVSPDLQKVIATPPPPFVAGPTTPEGWKKLQREHDSDQEKVAQALAKQREVKVQAAKVAGVKCYASPPRRWPAARRST
jgi:epsilon-lactone hydrolase